MPPYVFFVPNIAPPHVVLKSFGDDIRRSTSSRPLSRDSEFCVASGQKKVYIGGKIKMANAIKAVRSEKMGLKK